MSEVFPPRKTSSSQRRALAGTRASLGPRPGTEPEGTIVLTPPGRKAEDKVVDGGQKIVDRMVRKGWLRFARAACGNEIGQGGELPLTPWWAR